MTSAVIRRPAVAGYYYPAGADALRQQVEGLTTSDVSPTFATALIVPHGSFRHAGAVLGATWAHVAIPRRCIIVGPSHTGSWMPWSVMMNGAYRTPLGDVPIDASCAEALQSRCQFLSPDAWAQAGEHAIEVLLPFLQQRAPADLSVVPVIMGSDDDAEFARFAEALAQVVRMQEEPVLLIASSDLSHYEPHARAARRDRQLLEAIEALDVPAIIRAVREESVRMCGYGAVACVLTAAKQLGASRASLIAYGTSAEAGGDPHSVMGYAGLVVR